MTEPKSAIDDFAEISRRMKEIKGEPQAKPSGARPVLQSATDPEACLCRGMGWIAVRGKKTTWKGIVCPECSNPYGNPCPL